MPGGNPGRPRGPYAKTRRKAKALATLLKRKELADERWAEEVLTLALQETVDVAQLHDAQGRLLPVTRWPLAARRLIASLEVVIKNAAAGDGHTDQVLKVRHWDKLKALELWGKYRSLLVEKHEHTGEIDLVHRLMAWRERLHGPKK